MNKADIISALCRHGSMVTQADVDAFVEASDELSERTEPLDQGDVVALIGALDAGEDHPEVRWTVLHVIEHQDAGPYLLGTLEALARKPGSEWAGLLVGRLANAPAKWETMTAVLASASAEENARAVAAVRALTGALERDVDPIGRERGGRIAALAHAVLATG